MRPRLLWFCAVLLLAACRDEKIISYSAPKDAAPPAANLSDAAAGAPGIHWQKPAGWQEQPHESIRIGSFLVNGTDGAKADMSVTTFLGDVGGDLANVNRWRGQLGLQPIDKAALSQAVQVVDASAGRFQFVDLVGEASGENSAKKTTRLLGAWLKQPGRTWFFKLIGDDVLVAAQRENFTAFLKSVSFDTAPAAPIAPLASPVQGQSTNDLPKPGPAPLAGAGPETNPPTKSTEAALTWTAPSNWQPKALGQMRLASFSVRGENGAEADISVIAFPGEAGGVFANINRWRGQLGLAPIAENELASATASLNGAGGLRFTIADFTGQTGGAPARLLGAIVPFGGQTYFFKMTGPDALVAREKPAFLDFLTTVKAP
ncbi:MAG: hypothetical protein KGJ37_04730 [Verrucomicrobiota bacterium]|nr:hypothetical protein [Verrucomicrobiota bacterium]